MTNRTQSIEKKVLDRIYGHGRGWVFTPRHFLDLGARPAITSALKRHMDAGRIRLLARGLYDYPKQHPKLGILVPPTDAIAYALAGRDVVRLQPSGAYAANLLGLSEQVPIKAVFLTDGPSRRIRLGRQEIILKRTTPRNMATANRRSGLVIQALRQLGQRNVDRSTIEILRRRLSESDKQQLLKDVHYAPAWIAKAMREIANPPEDA